MFSLLMLILVLLLVALAPSLILFNLPHRTYQTVTGRRLPYVKLTLLNLVLVFIVMLIVNMMHTLHGNILELVSFVMWVSIPTGLVVRGFIGSWYKHDLIKMEADNKLEEHPLPQNTKSLD